MQPIAKVGDTGIGVCNCGLKCCPHTYSFTIISGSPNVFINNQSAAMIGSTTSTTCPHCPTGVIISGSGTVIVNRVGISRIGDTEVVPCGSGNIISGSGDTFTP